MSTDWPVMGTLTISITSTKGLVTIDPLQLVFNSGDFLKSFSITANDIGFETLNFALGGSDANFTNFSAGANTAPFTIIYRKN